MNDSELANIADRLFKAFEDMDGDTLRELFEPEAKLWSSRRGTESSIEDVIAYLPTVRETIGAHRYEEVRRLVAPDGFVEQHRVRSTRPDGEKVDMEVCVVVRVDQDTKIVRLDEYIAS